MRASRHIWVLMVIAGSVATTAFAPSTAEGRFQTASAEYVHPSGIRVITAVSDQAIPEELKNATTPLT